METESQQQNVEAAFWTTKFLDAVSPKGDIWITLTFVKLQQRSQMDGNFRHKYIYNRKHRQYSEKARQNLRLPESQFDSGDEYINEVFSSTTESPKSRTAWATWIEIVVVIALGVVSLFQDHMNANKATEDTNRMIEAIQVSSREQIESYERLFSCLENKIARENERSRVILLSTMEIEIRSIVREELAKINSCYQDENDENGTSKC